MMLVWYGEIGKLSYKKESGINGIWGHCGMYLYIIYKCIELH